MDPKQISKLAKLLRDSGDKVLNYNFKLTLTGIVCDYLHIFKTFKSTSNTLTIFNYFLY